MGYAPRSNNMKSKKISVYKRLINAYDAWRAQKQMKVMDTLKTRNLDQAIYLANRKRDIVNHKIWVINGPGFYLVFDRSRLHELQTQKILDKHTTCFELDKKASYIAYPETATNKKRGGLLRIFNKGDGSVKDKRIIRTTR